MVIWLFVSLGLTQCRTNYQGLYYLFVYVLFNNMETELHNLLSFVIISCCATFVLLPCYYCGVKCNLFLKIENNYFIHKINRLSLYLYPSLYVLTDFRMTLEGISYIIVAYRPTPAFGHLSELYFTFCNL